MKNEQVRIHALDVAMRLYPDISDLPTLFGKSDVIVNYIQGVKQPLTVNFTNAQLKELVASSDSVLEFAKHCHIQHITKGAIKFEPYPFQENLIDFLSGQPHAVLNMARQMGKTTCICIYALWFALFNPGQTVLIMSSRMASALEIMDRIRYMFELLPPHLRTDTTTYSKSCIEFDNGSRIMARAASSDAFRGMNVNLTIIDELAYISHSLAPQMWTNLQPMLSVAGNRCIVTSTPHNTGDTFHRIWTGSYAKTNPATGRGENGFAPFFAPWSCHPERDEAWAAPFRQNLGARRFAQEFECMFVS